MRNRKKKAPVAFEVIEAAIAGDVVAINKLLTIFNHTLTADAGESL